MNTYLIAPGPRLVFAFLVLVIGLVQIAGAEQATPTEAFSPTTIQFPGSSTTVARGINSSGDIVGNYLCSAAAGCTLTGPEGAPGSHAFLLQDGVYTRIDVPGGSASLARGISEQGMVVGQYNAGGATHGFVYLDGIFQTIDVPPALFDNLPPADPLHMLAVGISPQGDIVGCFHEGNASMTTMHGWLLRNGTFTALMTPHFKGDTQSRDPDTMNNGIAPTGEIVGFYFAMGVSYVADSSGIVTTFTFDGNRFTRAWGINARGDIVGVVGDNQAETVGNPVNPRGFLRTRHGEYRALEVEGATVTEVFGINARRQIVGSYTDATGTHGFTYQLSRGDR